MTYKPKMAELVELVGNPDVYAVQHKDGSWHPVREPLTPAVLRAHRKGDITVGTYIVAPPDQARTLVLDIDAADEDEQRYQLRAVVQVLIELNKGIDPDVGGTLHWFIEESGRKGYHVWIVADEYMDAAVLYRLGRGIRDEAGYPAMEVFPKQTEVRDLGNLVKLPGGFHAVTGKPNDTLQPELEANPVELLVRLSALYPEVGLRKRAGGTPQAIEYPCVHDIQGGVREGGRNIHLFHLAVMLRKFSLTDENVELLVRRANDASVDGPLPEDELVSILDNSAFSGPVCGQLSDDVNCGEQCILARHSGLYTRAGALKWATDGEIVTVEVKDRTDDGQIVELVHPDIVQGRAILAEPKPTRKQE